MYGRLNGRRPYTRVRTREEPERGVRAGVFVSGLTNVEMSRTSRWSQKYFEP